MGYALPVITPLTCGEEIRPFYSMEAGHETAGVVEFCRCRRAEK